MLHLALGIGFAILALILMAHGGIVIGLIMLAGAAWWCYSGAKAIDEGPQRKTLRQEIGGLETEVLRRGLKRRTGFLYGGGSNLNVRELEYKKELLQKLIAEDDKSRGDYIQKKKDEIEQERAQELDHHQERLARSQEKVDAAYNTVSGIALVEAASYLLERLDSEPEALLLTRLIKEFQLKPCEGNAVEQGNLRVEVQKQIGRYRVDFCINHKYVIEVDGRSYHDNPSSFQADRIRDQELEMDGYRTVRFTAWQIYKDCDRAVEYVRRVVLGQETNLARKGAA